MLQRLFHVECLILRNMSKKCKVDFLKQYSNSTDSGILGINSIIKCSEMDSETINKINKLVRYASPLKSESDKKTYSVIKLENGLTALLCSDLVNGENLSESINMDNLSNNSSDNEVSDSETDDSISSNISEERESRSEDKKEEKLAACSLSIGVGSFSDPPEIPGLAHFLEHMVFMGSLKYPQENEFDSFIKMKGGSDNASTDSEQTTFYFECPEKHLPKAMDIFSQLFISPLMKRDAMTREREAIQSEFTMSLPKDSYRKQQLICTAANDDNPGKKFAWGNLITLRDNVSDDVLYEEVHKFRLRHYSAHRMTLAIQARLPLDVIESWVVKYFSNIPSNDLPPLEHKLNSEPFRTNLFNKIYYVESVSDLMQIDINWVMPETLKKYKSKPVSYLSWKIGHEGKGSLISYLRKKLWAIGLSAGENNDGALNNSLYSVFTITIYLTETGTENIKGVLDAVFSYFEKIKQHGPDTRIFNEIKDIAEIDFRFLEEQTAVVNVEGLSEAMQIYPSEHYIAGSELYWDFQPDEITTYLNFLNPSSANIMISKKNHGPEINLDKVEEWFGTRYTYTNIPSDWILTWENVQPYDNFHVPEPNPYITSDFKIYTDNEEAPKYPVKIESSPSSELWYKPDNKFKHPVVFVGFHIVTSITNNSILNSTLLQLYIFLLNHFLIEEVYPANMASLQHLIYVSDQGLLIEIYGFSEKLHLILNKIGECILKFNDTVNEDLLNTFLMTNYRSVYNKNLKRSILAKDIRMSLLLDSYITSLANYNSLSLVNLDLLKQFSNNLFNKVYIQCLVQGNILENNALNLCNNFIKTLNPTGISFEEKPKFLIYELSTKERNCHIKSFNLTDSNCYVTNYYQFGPASVRDYCTADLLTMIMEEPLFDQLRTQQQLGYDISCSIRDTYGILGFSITVVSPIEKHDASDIESRISQFLNNFLITLKTDYSMNDFHEIRQSLIRLKQCCDVHIKDEIRRNWNEIKCFGYGFSRLERQVNELETLDLEDVINFLENRINAEMSSFKKLSVAVIGYPAGNSDIGDTSEEQPYQLPKSLEYQFVSGHPQDNFITNIQNFKSTLIQYPESKIF